MRTKEFWTFSLTNAHAARARLGATGTRAILHLRDFVRPSGSYAEILPLSTLINEIADIGHSLMITLRWNDGENKADRPPTPEEYTGSLAWLKAVVDVAGPRLGDCAIINIYNEPSSGPGRFQSDADIDTFCSWMTDAAKMIRSMSDQVNIATPAFVALGLLTNPPRRPTEKQRFMIEVNKRLLQACQQIKPDLFDVHLNAAGVNHCAMRLEEAIQVAERYGMSDTPIISSESGIAWYPDRENEDAACYEMVQMYNMLLDHHRVRMVCYAPPIPFVNLTPAWQWSHVYNVENGLSPHEPFFSTVQRHIAPMWNETGVRGSGVLTFGAVVNESE